MTAGGGAPTRLIGATGHSYQMVPDCQPVRSKDPCTIRGAATTSSSAGAGNDTIAGNAGADTLRGDAGGDRLAGGDGNDRLFGDAGYDSPNGGRGADALNGGAGIDTAVADRSDRRTSIEKLRSGNAGTRVTVATPSPASDLGSLARDHVLRRAEPRRADRRGRP